MASITPPSSPHTLPSPQQSDVPLLPAILCLHGGGSNATVFEIQCRRLIWNLESHFRFVFAQAPIEGEAGHGMLPVFESCAPFHRWVSMRYTVPSKIENHDKEETPIHEICAVDEALRQTMVENGGVDSFVGLIGFSMGSGLVAGLLLRQLVEERDLGSCWSNFKFGVMVGGPFPPIGMTETVNPNDYRLLSTMPTVHAWGRDDHIRAGCEHLYRVSDGDMCFQMEFSGGHHMPLKDAEARDLCDLIWAAVYAGGGQIEIAGGVKY